MLELEVMVSKDSHASIDHQFHDDTIHAIQFIPVDVDDDNWECELVLDIDHIINWVKSNKNGYEFDVVEATLSFHDVSKISIQCSILGGGANPIPIDRIERSDEPTIKRGEFMCFGWIIFLNDGDDGTIRFVASRYSLDKARKPIRLSEQMIPKSQRLGLSRRSCRHE
jgi:hypothetical protein